MRGQRVETIREAHEQQSKQVYYLCMEFLMGRSLKNTLYNLNLTEDARRVLDGFGSSSIPCMSWNPTRALETAGWAAWPPVFWTDWPQRAFPQSAIPSCTNTASSGRSWWTAGRPSCPTFGCPAAAAGCCPRPELTKEVRFDGHIDEWWDAGGFHHVEHRDATVVVAPGLRHDGRGQRRPGSVHPAAVEIHRPGDGYVPV